MNGTVAAGVAEKFSISRVTRCGAKVTVGGRVIGEIHHWTAAGASVRLLTAGAAVSVVIPTAEWPVTDGLPVAVRVSHVEVTDEDFAAGRFGYEVLSR